MDHSVNGYLQRRSTEELCIAIDFCLHEQCINRQEPVIRKAIEIIKSRYNESLPADLVQKLNQYQQMLAYRLQTEQK